MYQFSPRVVILLLITQTFLLISCGKDAEANVDSEMPENASSEDSKGVKTAAEELSLLINMPYEAEDIVWKEDKDRTRLTAVLRFGKDDTDKLNADLESSGASSDSTIDPEVWFPDELRSQSEMRGDRALKGKSYPARRFYQEPYTEGKITRIEGTDFFVLELVAK